jgi:hypothetical protein
MYPGTELLENAGARGSAARARLRLSAHHQADKLAAREQALDDLVYRYANLANKFPFDLYSIISASYTLRAKCTTLLTDKNKHKQAALYGVQ